MSERFTYPVNVVHAVIVIARDVYIAILVGTAIFSLADPEAVGTWLARRDVAYDQVWIEYMADCDCTEPLE